MTTSTATRDTSAPRPPRTSWPPQLEAGMTCSSWKRSTTWTTGDYEVEFVLDGVEYEYEVNARHRQGHRGRSEPPG